MIYTGYFARTKKYIENNLHPISVADKTPSFFTYPKWNILAPRKNMLYRWKNGEISNDVYVKLYKSYLESEISKELLDKIKYLSENNNIVLCCYEKPSDFCHRHILAEWLGNKLSIDIKEYEI